MLLAGCAKSTTGPLILTERPVLPEPPSWLGAPVKIQKIADNGDPYAYAAQCITALGLANRRQANARVFYARVRKDYGG